VWWLFLNPIWQSIHAGVGYAAVDVFTCGEKVNPWDACNYLTERFKAKHMTATEVKRGVFEELLKLQIYNC